MVSVSNILGTKNAPIFDFSVFFDGKVNQVGAFGSSNFKTPSNFKKRQEKKILKQFLLSIL